MLLVQLLGSPCSTHPCMPRQPWDHKYLLQSSGGAERELRCQVNEPGKEVFPFGTFIR